MTKHQARTLLITRNFPPLWGGMERLNWHLAEELAKHYEVRVIAPAGAARLAPSGVAVSEAPLVPLPRFLGSAAWLALNEARRFKPDIVLAGSGLTAPIAWSAARACRAKSAVYVHGLDLTAPHPLYRALWHPALRRIERVIANSHATAALAQNIGIAPERIRIVHPGVEIPQPDPEARTRFRAAHGIAREVAVLLSVGRLTERKGLREFVRDVLPRIKAARPDAMLVIIGEAPEHALYAQAQTREEIQAAAEAAGVAGAVRFLGKRFGKELTDAYFAADVHVFPVRELPNDPEGFGMVAVEAAAHGLPTVAYATGGVVDAVAEGRSGHLVLPGDAEGFAEAVLRILSVKHQSPLPGMTDFARKMSWAKFGRGIMNALAGNSL